MNNNKITQKTFVTVSLVTLVFHFYHEAFLSIFTNPAFLIVFKSSGSSYVLTFSRDIKWYFIRQAAYSEI